MTSIGLQLTAAIYRNWDCLNDLTFASLTQQESHK